MAKPIRTVCVTVRLSEAAACSREPEDSVSWPAGTSGREAAGCYWEETNQCRATAAPSPSPHCTCNTENEGGEAGSQAQERHRKSGEFFRIKLVQTLGHINGRSTMMMEHITKHNLTSWMASVDVKQQITASWYFTLKIL